MCQYYPLEETIKATTDKTDFFACLCTWFKVRISIGYLHHWFHTWRFTCILSCEVQSWFKILLPPIFIHFFPPVVICKWVIYSGIQSLLPWSRQQNLSQQHTSYQAIMRLVVNSYTLTTMTTCNPQLKNWWSILTFMAYAHMVMEWHL